MYTARYPIIHMAAFPFPMYKQKFRHDFPEKEIQYQ